MGILAILSPLLFLYAPERIVLEPEAPEEVEPLGFLQRFTVEVDESFQTNASVVVAERELGAMTFELGVENLLDVDWRSLTPVVSVSWPL